jgi:hypothetical protein
MIPRLLPYRLLPLRLLPLRRPPYRHLRYGFLTAALVACGAVTVDASRFDTDCFRMTGGQITVDYSNGTWSFQGACFERKHNLCPEISSAKFQIGVDTNGNGSIDAGEPQESFSCSQVGNQVCVAATSGSYNGPPADVLVHFEVNVEGQTEPAWSKTDKVPRD